MTGKVAAPGTALPGAEKVDQHYRPDIEGLRAVAVVAVVLFHAGVMFLPGGFVGVDVFFVISGFLITGMLWRETGRTGTVSLRRFWAARARRLLPASVLVGIITAVASAMLLPPLQSKTVSIDAITSALYVSNYWFAFTGVNYFGRENLLAPSPFQHYWSLGVEEQFYLVWPLLILFTAWVIRRFRRGRVDGPTSPMPYLAVLALIAAVSFFLSVALTYVLPPFAYFSLPTRAWQLALGGIVAFTAPWWRKLPVAPAAMVGWCGLGLIVAAYVLIDGTSPYPGVVAALPTAGAALVIAAGCAASSSGAGALLGTAPMRAIGRVSYSWYLWHWPVLVLVPAVAWLYWTGDNLWGTFLLVWTLVVGTMDNVLRPYLIKKGADLPLLLIFAGVIGGMITLGLVGIFVGPVVLAVAYTLVDAWVEGDPGRDLPPAANS